MKPNFLEKIIREFKKESSDVEKGTIILDTGALIDIQRAMRPKKYCGTHFLEDVEKYGKILVCPKIFDEIRSHSHVKINGNIREINPDSLGRAYLFKEQFLFEYYPFFEKGQAALQNWLLIRNVIAPEIARSYGTEPSEADLDLLTHASHISSLPRAETLAPEKVIVLTSDRHITHGAKELKKLGYNISSISTRI